MSHLVARIPAGAEPLGALVVDVMISMLSIAVLSIFLTRRISAIQSWRKLPFVVWLVFAIFIDSWLFVFVTAILKQAVGINTNYMLCSSAILLCLICYVTTKFVVRNGVKSRLQSKLYIFNSFGMLSIYFIIAVLNFIYRINRIDNNICYIGMKRPVLVPLISFDLVVNIYLTLLFLYPLLSLYSYKDMPRTRSNERLRSISKRTFIGALSTTISSVVNLTVLMALDGEPGWVCLLCCNCDILFSAVVIQWVTTRDNAATRTNNDYEGSNRNREGSRDTGTSSHRRDTLNMNMDKTIIKMDEIDVTSYPMQPAGAFKSIDELDGAERGKVRNGSLSDDTSTHGLVETPNAQPVNAVMGVRTIIVASSKESWRP
ncbi:hypothetical protein G7054_g4903 [Neopestalotiopsis clavispora]|nr:hypothetical protein G7054_g4903 [Neopestalotiopsis clavispora]